MESHLHQKCFKQRTGKLHLTVEDKPRALSALIFNSHATPEWDL